MITPAISVLSRGRGHSRSSPPASTDCVVPIAVRDPRRRCSPCSGAAPAAIGKVFGPIMVALVRRARRARRHRTSPTHPDGAAAPSTRPTPSSFFVDNGVHGFLVARLGLPRRHRRRGALRRHGPLRARARSRSAWFALVLPGAAAQLLRPGRAAARASPRPSTTPSTGWRPTWALVPARRARHGGHRHRLAGAHLRRVLAHPAGGAARLPARASRIAPHLRDARRARSTSRPSTGR